MVKLVQNSILPAGGKAFFDWMVDLPWKRVSIWAFVALFALQLRDFFGVCFTLHRILMASLCLTACHR